MQKTPVRCSVCKISVAWLVWHELNDDAYVCQICAVREVKRLRALLPQTADKKLIEVGEFYYYLLKDGSAAKFEVIKIAFQTGYDYWWCDMRQDGHDPAFFSPAPCAPAHDFYSTESSALAAQKEQR